jgi:hypothetical protein
VKVQKKESFYLFQDQGVELQAEITNKKDADFVSFTKFNGQPFELSHLDHPLFFKAEAYLYSVGHSSVHVLFSGEDCLFPVFESLRNFSELKGQGRVLFEKDRYDGPISGVLELNGKLYWFDWCMESVGNERSYQEPRIFSLREVSKNEESDLKISIQKLNDLKAELRVVMNPDRYPVNELQKSKQRRIEEIETEIEKVEPELNKLKNIPISAWVDEGVCSSDFAAIQVIHMTKEDSDRYQQWQKDVADALLAEDQKSLNELFKIKQPIQKNEKVIYRVDKTSSDGKVKVILRDHQGQPLPADFWMTGSHDIQDLTHLSAK